jgi:hypothetical protein
MVKNTSRLPSLDPLEEAQIFNIGSQSAWQQAFPPPKLLGRCIWLAIFDWLRFLSLVEHRNSRAKLFATHGRWSVLIGPEPNEAEMET